jgi:hypothetical protein
MNVTFFSESEFETSQTVEYHKPYHIRGTQMIVTFHSETRYEVKGGEIEFDVKYSIESAKGWKLIHH